jgi:hypothetical protein
MVQEGLLEVPALRVLEAAGVHVVVVDSLVHGTQKMAVQAVLTGAEAGLVLPVAFLGLLEAMVP